MKLELEHCDASTFEKDGGSDCEKHRAGSPWDRQCFLLCLTIQLESEVVDFLEIAQPLIRKGRWWYSLMWGVRAWRFVWGHYWGKLAVLVCLVVAYQICAHRYVQALTSRVEVVGGAEFIEDSSSLIISFVV